MLGLQAVRQAQRHTQGGDTPREDEDEPLKQDTGEQKKVPPEFKTVNVLHVIKGSKAALPERYAQGPITAKSYHWPSQMITFDHRDYSASIRRAGCATLVLDPIIDGHHFYTSPDGRWQQFKPDIPGYNPRNGDRPNENPP